MCCGIAHGVLNPRIVPSLDSGIVPPIETMAYIASVAQRDVLFENCRARSQRQLDGPLHSINSVDIPNDDRCAAILAARVRKIHRGHGDPIVGKLKVKLESKIGPGSE